MAGPLSHIRVLDLSRILAGPWASQFLADLGAEVIKVERPGAGDDTRGWGPPYLERADGSKADAAYFLSANRGKSSVAIDIARPEGQALVRALAAECDVVVENFKVGGLARYGLDYEGLKAVNPSLIYCSITGFGQSGPYSHRAGYDFMIQGMGGLMSITGKGDGESGGGPVKVGVAVADLFTGMYAASAVLGALVHRERTGAGQHIDLALLDAQTAMLANQALNFLAGGMVPGRLGNAHPSIVPYEAFATADGHMILAVGNDGQFARFCTVAGLAELADDERFATNAARVANRHVLCGRIAETLATRTTEAWLEALEPVGVPCGPINPIDQVFADPQIRARGMQIAIARGDGAVVPGVANPVNYSATAIEYRKAPPVLGADTRDVLTRLLKMNDEEIAALKAADVIGEAG